MRRREDEEKTAAESLQAHLAAERARLALAIGELPTLDRAPERPSELATELDALEAAAADARERRGGGRCRARRSPAGLAVRRPGRRRAGRGRRRPPRDCRPRRRARRPARASRGPHRRRARGPGRARFARLPSSLAEATTAEAAAAEARAGAEDAREAARQALLDAERRLSGGSGRVTELEVAQQQAIADLSRLEEALAGLERERELALEGLPERGRRCGRRRPCRSTATKPKRPIHRRCPRTRSPRRCGRRGGRCSRSDRSIHLPSRSTASSRPDWAS